MVHSHATRDKLFVVLKTEYKTRMKSSIRHFIICSSFVGVWSIFYNAPFDFKYNILQWRNTIEHTHIRYIRKRIMSGMRHSCTIIILRAAAPYIVSFTSLITIEQSLISYFEWLGLVTPPKSEISPSLEFSLNTLKVSSNLSTISQQNLRKLTEMAFAWNYLNFK